MIPDAVFLSCFACRQETFGRAGVISKVVLPQTRTLALVEYQKSGEARQAFKALAFKRFQSVPLFLEWAPKDIFSGSPAQSAEVVSPLLA